jgi:hypothetical protein
MRPGVGLAAVRGERSAQPLAPVRRVEVEDRPQRDHSGRVDGGVALVIVALDVPQIDGLGDARGLVEVAQVA